MLPYASKVGDHDDNRCGFSNPWLIIERSVAEQGSQIVISDGIERMLFDIKLIQADGQIQYGPGSHVQVKRILGSRRWRGSLSGLSGDSLGRPKQL